jgi:hypothetical protein
VHRHYQARKALATHRRHVQRARTPCTQPRCGTIWLASWISPTLVSMNVLT